MAQAPHRFQGEAPFYLALLSIVMAAQLFRTWAAGFVETTARERETHAEVLLTAGPYAYVRNPMYLGILVMVLSTLRRIDRLSSGRCSFPSDEDWAEPWCTKA